MSNKVWVTWNDAAGKTVHVKVINLADDADVDDLRKNVVDQQKLTVGSGFLSVSEKKGGVCLNMDVLVKQYFIGSADPAEAPGKTLRTALVITLPQQQQNGKLHCCLGY